MFSFFASAFRINSPISVCSEYISVNQEIKLMRTLLAAILLILITHCVGAVTNEGLYKSALADNNFETNSDNTMHSRFNILHPIRSPWDATSENSRGLFFYIGNIWISV